MLACLTAAGCNQKESLATEAAGKENCCKPADKNKTTAQTDFSESLFQIEDSFETQDNQKTTLSAFRGKPTVVGMIFTNCGYACPRLTADIQQIEHHLGSDKDKVNFLLVSFDTERDIPAQLKSFAADHKLNKNWTLLHGNEDAVRTLSVLLNVQYEKDAAGNFSHSNLVSVLDENGVLVYQKEGLEANHVATLEKIESMLH